MPVVAVLAQFGPGAVLDVSIAGLHNAL